MQTMIEKLRLIADAIEQGKDVETRGSFSGTYAESTEWKQMNVPHVHVWTGNEYRIKPDKPRTVIVSESLSEPKAYQAIELTPEVREACNRLGLI